MICSPVSVRPRYARNLNEQLRGTNLILPVHFKIDTGMSRLGIPAQNMEQALCFLETIYGKVGEKELENPVRSTSSFTVTFILFDSIFRISASALRVFKALTRFRLSIILSYLLIYHLCTIFLKKGSLIVTKQFPLCS